MKKLILVLIAVLLVSSFSPAFARRNDTMFLSDDITGSTVTVDFSHHEAHDGDAFRTGMSNMTTNTGEMTCIGFNTPNTAKWAHLIVYATATAWAKVSLYENPSVDAGEGTEVTPINHNRNSSKTSTLSSIEAVPGVGEVTTFNETQAASANITTTVDLLFGEEIGKTGNPATASGGQSRGTSEVILEQDQQYIACVTALDNNDNYHGLHGNWYEHAN
ncbi:MAG: hypothetical protein KAJ19_07660 [Gammaproteobacteria bacterium]|nr:hypothetical protein [Gammaproteobacteria bacterium]